MQLEAKTINALIQEGVANGSLNANEIHDGFHSFKELYTFRMIYNATLFNEWHEQNKYEVHKSWKHNDGELCFGGGWFVVLAMLPTGQITNHYPESQWDYFKIPEEEIARFAYDGHSPQDVLDRLVSL